ncbi:uncharacterized protein ACA1_287500, partial [Acanthamoeba castellanii str. Neff]
ELICPQQAHHTLTFLAGVVVGGALVLIPCWCCLVPVALAVHQVCAALVSTGESHVGVLGAHG